jgi:hypothetical protein
VSQLGCVDAHVCMYASWLETSTMRAIVWPLPAVSVYLSHPLKVCFSAMAGIMHACLSVYRGQWAPYQALCVPGKWSPLIPREPLCLSVCLENGVQ